MSKKISIFWFRRDLRLNDNVGLFHALKSGLPILPIFIFDPEILKELPKDDARVSFIHKTLQDLNAKLQTLHQSGIAMFHGTPKTVFEQLTNQFEIESVFTNHDYEPYAIKRDSQIKTYLESKSIILKRLKTMWSLNVRRL